jgi:hypothetical protein
MLAYSATVVGYECKFFIVQWSLLQTTPITHKHGKVSLLVRLHLGGMHKNTIVSYSATT